MDRWLQISQRKWRGWLIHFTIILKVISELTWFLHGMMGLLSVNDTYYIWYGNIWFEPLKIVLPWNDLQIVWRCNSNSTLLQACKSNKNHINGLFQIYGQVVWKCFWTVITAKWYFEPILVPEVGPYLHTNLIKLHGNGTNASRLIVETHWWMGFISFTCLEQ